MVKNEKVRELVDAVFEEEALALGGLIVLHDVEDDFIWGLVRSLDAIRLKALRRIEQEQGSGGETGPAVGSVRPHPAIETFLADLRRG